MRPDSVKREELEPAVPQRAQLAAPVSESVWTGAVRAAEDRPGDASSKVKTEATEPSLARASVALPNTYLPTPPPATTESASTAVDSQARTAPPAPPQATAQSIFVNGQLEGARANVGSSERTGTQAEVEPRRGLLEAAVAPRPAQTQAASPTAPLTDANLSRLHNATAVEQSGEQARKDYAQSNADSLSSASSSIAERTPVASSSQPQDVGMWTAKTASPAMKLLVRKRAEIFEAQRGAREHPLQKSSQERVESTFAQHLATQGPYLSGFRNYVAFCDRCHIPPFPLTYTIMALWLYDKCSLSDGYFHTYKYGLLLAADVVLASWKSERVYKQVSRFDSGGLALSEFFEERRLMYQKAPTKGASPKKAPQQRKLPKRPPSTGSDSSSETYGSEKEESNYTDSEEEGEPGDRSVELTSSCNVPVPGLPKSTDVFATEIDLYKAYVAALVPVYGVSVILATTSPSAATIKCNRSHQHYASSPGGTCSWTCVARREDSGWRIDAAASNFSHTHGPCKEILMDPNWRPKVHNPYAREALGMPPLRAAKKKPTRWTARQSTVSSDEEPLQKKPRLSVRPAAFPSTTGSLAIAGPAPSYSMRPSPVSTSMVSQNAPRFPLRSSPAAAAPSSFAPPVQPPARPPMPPPALRAPPILQARLSDAPEQLVAAFCAGLHPSLDALAKPLVSIGIDSIEALILLRLMDPRHLSRLLDAMRQRWTARRACDPSLPSLSLVHLNLFAKFVKA